MRYNHVILLAIFFMSLPAFAESTKFSFSSKDGQAQLSGYLTYAENKAVPQPLVIMIPGTGLFDADVHFGKSGTEKDFIFVSIEKRLAALGFAVLRMNYRGVFCNFFNYPNKCTSCTPQTQLEEFKKACLDTNIRAKVTPAIMRDDFEQIYNWAVRQPSIDSKNVIMFGHSEGTTHISRLIEQKRIAPKGLVFMGGVTESLDSLIHWQIVDRMVENLILMDQDKDSKINNDEIKLAHPDSILSIFPIESLLSPTGSWTEKTFGDVMQLQYVLVQADALSKSDSAPYPNAELPQASYLWWKMFFTPDTPIIQALASFEGPVIYHNGSIDSQTSATREKNFLDSYSGLKPANVSFVTHPLKGHTLGADPLWGPITDDSMDTLIKSFEDILKK